MGKILITGATGYIGGRLVRALEHSSRQIRCMARRPEVLLPRVSRDVDVVAGDVLLPDTLRSAMEDVDTAYYLVHSLGLGASFEAVEAEGASNFAAAARQAGVKKIIYLGGLSDADTESPHMRSRHHVGDLLRASGVPTLEFRASVILGSGSLSFELIRALVGRLPIMITPRWVHVKAQPIGVNDVLAYLVAALESDATENPIYEIGGKEQMSYGELMKVYAEKRGLRRLIIPVPVLTPRLSSLWLGLVTPVFARIGRKLIDSMTSPSVVRNPAALDDFSVRPVGIREAIDQALRNEDQEFAETHWADALSSVGKQRNWGGVKFGARIVDSRSIEVDAPPEQAFAPIARIGGRTGWYYGNILWALRGLLDRTVGGVGMHRGRRDQESLRVGDVLDCWRVEAFEAPHRLLLAAEMKLPGRAWLQFEVQPRERGSVITQTAIYDPVGLGGLLYWYSLYIVHQFVFSGMLRNIGKAADRKPSKNAGTKHPSSG